MNPLRIVVMENGPLVVDDHDTTMRQLGLIDGRTGLPHRDLLLDRLGQAAAGVARGGSAFALMYIRTTVSSHMPPGEALELVLQRFATQLHRLGRRTDSFARMGDLEFAALLPGNPSVAGLMSMGQKIASEFADRLQVHAGVALCPRHSSDPEALLLQARTAMEQACAAQVVTALYEPRAPQPARTARPAAPAAPAEVRPTFLPMLDLRTGGLSCLQISTGELGRSQADFQPTDLSQPGQIHRRDLQAHLLRHLDAALRCAVPWRQQGLVDCLLLPLPGRLLDEPTLAPAVLALLDQHRWPARQFRVEAHAAAIAQRGSLAIDALCAAGVGLVVDDGQTGLSLHLALAGIESVTAFKVSTASLTALPRAEQRAAVVRSLVALARGWNARLIADGVDDLTTLAWLGELGCDEAEGSACGRAMPAEQVHAWCAGHGGSALSSRSAAAPSVSR